jgi:hypothetical protein
MRTREDFDAGLLIVTSVVRSWDPYRLIGSGAPTNEFDAEIAKVVSCIPRISNGAAAAAALSLVFSASFEPELFSLAQCAVPGQELFAKLLAAGLVASA